VKTWFGYAISVLTPDRKTFQEIAGDAYMTGPALLLSLLGTLTMASLRAGELDWTMIIGRYLLWFLLVLILFGAGRLLGGKGSYTSTLRTMGFAQGIYILDLLAFIPPISSLVRILVTILTFIATWLGVAEAHELKGWRAILIPIAAIAVIILGLLIISTVLEGFEFTIESLMVDFGLSPQ
jgi:hypothetical protein